MLIMTVSYFLTDDLKKNSRKISIAKENTKQPMLGMKELDSKQKDRLDKNEDEEIAHLKGQVREIKTFLLFKILFDTIIIVVIFFTIKIKSHHAIVDTENARPINMEASTPSTPVKNASVQLTEELLPVAQPTETPAAAFVPVPPPAPPSVPPQPGVTIPTHPPAPTPPPAPVSPHATLLHGAPPPTPPPGAPGLTQGPPELQLHVPYGMKPKKKYEPQEKTKHINWETVNIPTILEL